MRVELICTYMMVFFVAFACFAQEAEQEGQTIAAAYPGLVTGGLAAARMVSLPEGILARSQGIEVTEKDIESETMRMAPWMQSDQIRKHALFVLEKVVTDRLLLKAAKEEAKRESQGSAATNDDALVNGYLSRAVGEIKVTDEEIGQFYEANASMFCGAPLDQVKGQIKSHLTQQKREDRKTEHIRSLGESAGIEVAATWAEEKAKLALDNPVDKARGSGKHSLIVFSAGSCCGKDRMLPLVQSVREKHANSLNVIYVNAKTDQLLCERYGIQSIPTEVFFDEKGIEASRTVGFMDEGGIEEILSTMGVD